MDWKKMVQPASKVEAFKKASVKQQRTAVDVVSTAIDKQIELFNKPRAEGRRWFEIKGDQVAFTIRYANKPLKLVGDETTAVVEKGQFVDVLNAIKADVAKGAFKDQLDAVEANVQSRSAKMAETRRNKKKA